MRFLTQLRPRRFHSANNVFELTAEDRALIADGANIALTVVGVQPPVMVRLTDEPLGRRP